MLDHSARSFTLNPEWITLVQNRFGRPEVAKRKALL